MTELTFTDRELDVMNVLWERGSGTVVEVRECLEDDLAYTTVLTMLRILEEKGFVTHEEEGRAHRYLPVVERRRARESALRRMTRRLFSGSPELLLTHLVEDEGLEDEDLARIRRLLEERLEDAGEGKGPGPEGGGDGRGSPGAGEGDR